MQKISIISEANIGIKVANTCKCTVWVFIGDWDAYTDFHGEDLENQAVKILGPVVPDIDAQVRKGLKECFSRLGYEVLYYDTADD